jgi:hypothetical protein
LLRLSPHDPNLTGLAAPYVMLGCYLPALAIVLHRPDEGAVQRSVSPNLMGYVAKTRFASKASVSKPKPVLMPRYRALRGSVVTFIRRPKTD